MKKQMRIGILVVALAIIVAGSLLLFVPSARTVKHGKILNALSKKYKSIDPKSIEPVLNGNLVTVDNNFKPIQSDEAALIYVWAPTMGSTRSYTLIQGLSAFTLVGTKGHAYKKAILIATHPRAVGWALLGKVHLAQHIQHIHSYDLFPETGELAANPKMGIDMLQKKWDSIPKAIQFQAELMLSENREIFKKYSREGLILQTGLGSFYDIGIGYPNDVLNIVGENLPYLPPAK